MVPSRGEMLHRVPQLVAAGRARLMAAGWLATTTSAFQEALLDRAIWKTADTGEEFQHAGDMNGDLVGIASGTAEIAFPLGHPDTRFVHLAHPGHWSGYRPLLGRPKNHSLVARTNVLFALVPHHAASRLLRENPEYWMFFASWADLGQEIAVQVLVDLTRKDSLVRAAATLLRLGGCRLLDPVDDDAIEVRVLQADIAALAVMSRNTISLHLRELSRRGLIELRFGCIRLIRPAGLRALVTADE
jgi:CRP-like cAMP-binding protein